MRSSLANRVVLTDTIVTGPDGCETRVNTQEFQLSQNQTAILTFEIYPIEEGWLAWAKRMIFRALFPNYSAGVLTSVD